eukprot:m.95706 g.95706  ORF g.95706 m.95706 type:complete len:161 (-) comp13508_c0_seq4:238-720(-)
MSALAKAGVLVGGTYALWVSKPDLTTFDRYFRDWVENVFENGGAKTSTNKKETGIVGMLKSAGSWAGQQITAASAFAYIQACTFEKKDFGIVNMVAVTLPGASSNEAPLLFMGVMGMWTFVPPELIEPITIGAVYGGSAAAILSVIALMLPGLRKRSPFN